MKNRYVTQFVISVFTFLMVLGSLSSCENHDTDDRIARKGDYLALERDVVKYYLREQYALGETEPYVSDTIKIVFKGDTLIEGRAHGRLEFYSMHEVEINKWIEMHDLYRIIRVEGSKYFYLPYSSDPTEYMFLDTERPVGESWTYSHGYDHEFKTTYTIEAVNATRTVNGIEYHNIIIVSEKGLFKNYDGVNYDHTFSGLRYFAKGVGEIYNSSEFYSYPVGLRITYIGKD
jgi:hypothetical protein